MIRRLGTRGVWGRKRSQNGLYLCRGETGDFDVEMGNFAAPGRNGVAGDGGEERVDSAV